jgi:hypothetical protein
MDGQSILGILDNPALSAFLGFQAAAYSIKAWNYHTDMPRPQACDGDFCSFAHGLYRTNKAKILLGVPFPLDLLYACYEYQKSKKL